MDNSAIERIADSDLTGDVLSLLEMYRDNDDVIFFLGRLVWQGKMANCASALFDIAIDQVRGQYARIAAIRGVMSVGDDELKERLWETIATDTGPLDRGVLAELLDGAPPTTASIRLLLRSLEHVVPHSSLTVTGLGRSLHDFIDRLPVMADSSHEHPLGYLTEGLNIFLEREPFVEPDECSVSKEFEWLMSAALHAVDRMVAARSAQALKPGAITILRNSSTLRFWRGTENNEYKTSLSHNVSRWPELNDLLYWSSIKACRARIAAKDESLIDDWRIACIRHFWGFGSVDFERCLDWVKTKDGDDRFVALSRCVRLYVEADRPSAWLANLRAAVVDDEMLKSALEAHLNPKPSLGMEKMEAEHHQWMREWDARDREEKKNRADWVRALKADPDRVRHPSGLKSPEVSNDQYNLLNNITVGRGSSSREDGANWRVLIPEFGESVARAFRDAAIAHWRAYIPPLRSEGAVDTGSTPFSLIFALTGLAIEAGEDSSFVQRLSEKEARLAFRYITWELNGFPSWLEPLYRVFSDIGRDAVLKELVWELEHSVAESSLHYVINSILYHAPWLHSIVAPFILNWLRTHDMPNAIALDKCLNILAGGSIGSKEFATLAADKSKGTTLVGQRPRWFALWVDADSSAAIPILEALLDGLSASDATAFSEQFIVGLIGDRHGTGKRIAAYRNAGDLKSLYILMHRYIRTAEDIDRIGKGAYSPTLRDNAQDARSTLFNMLFEVPGEESYVAMKELEAEHPDPTYRRWIAVKAHQRATQDADEPHWSTEQVRDFTYIQHY